jgi:flagellar motility protein MotE (MotC chaperone)
MTQPRWVRTAIGAVVVVKVLGLVPFLAGPARRSDPQATASEMQPAAPVAEQGGSEGQAGNSPGAASERREGSRIPAEDPSAAFSAQSNVVREFHEAMRRRSEEIAAREADLLQRENAIAAASKDLEKKITHLESLGTAASEVQQPAMEELGKIYGAMKAEEAAPLLDRLDDETVLAIFGHMKQRQISAVLPLMNPEKAVALTELLGGRGRSRKPTGEGGG